MDEAPRLCHYEHTKVVKSFSNTGLTKVPEASYCMDTVWYWMIQLKQQHGVSFPELQFLLKILFWHQSNPTPVPRVLSLYLRTY